MNTETMDTPELDLDSANVELLEVATEEQEALILAELEELIRELSANVSDILPMEEIAEEEEVAMATPERMAA